MRRVTLEHRSAWLRDCLLISLAAFATSSAEALRMLEMPTDLQTENAEPAGRRLSLKLPLLQPVFHWTFHSREELLSGRLIIYIDRGTDSTVVTVFEDGKLADGWEILDSPAVPKAGSAYFGFRSAKKYLTAPGDRLRVELLVKRDLRGIGPTQTGVLTAGTYRSKGSYSGLLDAYTVPPGLAGLPEEALAKLREGVEFMAFLENWETQWPLRITSEEGWLVPEQRAAYEQHLKLMTEEDSKEQP